MVMSDGGAPSESAAEWARVHAALSKPPSWDVMECCWEVEWHVNGSWSSESPHSYTNGVDDRSDMWFTVSGYRNADCSLPAGWKGKRSTEKPDQWILNKQKWEEHCMALRIDFRRQGIAPFCD